MVPKVKVNAVNKRENTIMKNADDYDFIAITRFSENGGILSRDNVQNGMSKIAKIITNTANSFTDITSEVDAIVITLETNSEGIGFNDYHKTLSVHMYRRDNNIVVRISDNLNNYPGYMNAIKKGFKDADKSIHFVDSDKNMVKIFNDTKDAEKDLNEVSTTACCAVNACERDNDNVNDSNPFYNLLGEIDCYNDDNININHIQHEVINDIKDLITGAKQVWNLKYDANIINDIKDLINECYKLVEKDLQK